MPSIRTPGASAATAPSIILDNPNHHLAHSIGCDCANEWLNRRPGDAIPPASLVAWRARCYADAVREHEDRADFLQLLAAWERGFDSTMEAGQRERSAQSRRESINHLRWQAKAVANLLSAVHLLSVSDQKSTLAVSARLADELAGDLSALVGGAA